MKNLLDTAVYAYKRNGWMLDRSRNKQRDAASVINKPIFLLGVQGGGLTFVSRVLRRHSDVVSVTGDSSYWWGADEMQNVLWKALPVEFAGIKHRYPDDTDFTKPRGWLYAVDELLQYYQKSARDATPALAQTFQQILAWQISRHGRKIAHPRFTDKSQVFTVKIPFIEEILKDSDPHFILVTRNPYALCYRSVIKPGEAPELKALVQERGHDAALKYAAQHWASSMKIARQDGKKAKNFITVSFEEFLQHPEKELQKICRFADLEYNKNMLPQSSDKIGLGSRPGHKEKWYPIRPQVNDRYLAQITQQDIDIIAKECEGIAKKFGYNKPNPLTTT